MVVLIVKDKKTLELLLEHIPRYNKPKKELEQYETPASIVSHILWIAYMKNDVKNKKILEPGCGVARFSIGSLILGADNVICIDIDYSILEYSKNIINKIYSEYTHRIIFLHGNFINLYIRGVDTIIMNPPFGVVKKNKGIDIMFLRKALSLANNIYTIHKFSQGLEKIVYQLVEIYGFKITYREILDFPIPMMFITHKRKIYRVKTVFYIIEKVK